MVEFDGLEVSEGKEGNSSSRSTPRKRRRVRSLVSGRTVTSDCDVNASSVGVGGGESDWSDGNGCFFMEGDTKPTPKRPTLNVFEKPQKNRQDAWTEDKLEENFEIFLRSKCLTRSYLSTCSRNSCMENGRLFRVHSRSGSVIPVCGGCVRDEFFESPSVSGMSYDDASPSQSQRPPIGKLFVKFCSVCRQERDGERLRFSRTVTVMSLSGSRLFRVETWRCTACDCVCGSSSLDFGAIEGLHSDLWFRVGLLRFMFHLRMNTRGSTSTHAFMLSMLGSHADTKELGFSWAGTRLDPMRAKYTCRSDFGFGFRSPSVIEKEMGTAYNKYTQLRHRWLTWGWVENFKIFGEGHDPLACLSCATVIGTKQSKVHQQQHVDGLHKLRLFRTASHTKTALNPSVFVNKSKLELFRRIREKEKASKRASTTHKPGACTALRAADGSGSAGHHKKFGISGVLLSACSHNVPSRCAIALPVGEKAHYLHYFVRRFLPLSGVDTKTYGGVFGEAPERPAQSKPGVVFYDLACRYEKNIHSHESLDASELPPILLGHVHRHAHKCEHARRTFSYKGTGLRSGEAAETLNAKIGNAGSRIVHMSSGRFMDTVTMMLTHHAQLSQSRTPYFLGNVYGRSVTCARDVRTKIEWIGETFSTNSDDGFDGSGVGIVDVICDEEELRQKLAGVFLQQNDIKGLQEISVSMNTDTDLALKIKTKVGMLEKKKNDLTRTLASFDFDVEGWRENTDGTFASDTKAFVRGWQADILEQVRMLKYEREVQASQFRRGTSQLVNSRDKSKRRRKVGALRKKIQTLKIVLADANKTAQKHGLESVDIPEMTTPEDVEDGGENEISREVILEMKERQFRLAEEVDEIVPNEADCYIFNCAYVCNCIDLQCDLLRAELDENNSSMSTTSSMMASHKRRRSMDLRVKIAALTVIKKQRRCWGNHMYAFQKLYGWRKPDTTNMRTIEEDFESSSRSSRSDSDVSGSNNSTGSSSGSGYGDDDDWSTDDSGSSPGDWRSRGLDFLR